MLMEARIAGIPCLVRILHCSVVESDPGADNPDDYYGYTEMDWEVCDRRGRRAPWLERKMTQQDAAEIETQIMGYMRNE